MNEKKTPNRLIREKSPYLLQHAYNPVDWYPWGDEAFEKAQEEDKPVFLSIGYSTCHWCHVMERESFEDHEVASLLNDICVCIKVDREERPDIDSVYMSVCQMMTGSGGWPLTIVMTPEKKPFFAATYIPKESRFGMMGLIDMLPRIQDAWMHQREHVLESADTIVSALQGFRSSQNGELNTSVVEAAYKMLVKQYDEHYGGFGTAPKFPMPHTILFLLRYYKRFHEEKAREMTEKTLNLMSQGGIWDHIGYGFHRYSTDRYWLVPHFEKMLYDQALLALAYTEAYQVTRAAKYRKTAEHIFEYVLRDMTSPEGGFYSAEDADSEGEEGKFYTWEEKEISQLVDDTILTIFSVSEEGNFPERGKGVNILHMRTPVSEYADTIGVSLKELCAKIEEARRILFSMREKRIHPSKDDKILTDWNGLMIAALSKAAQSIDRKYRSPAKRAADFIIDTMVNSSTHLYHRYRDGDIRVPGFLDDYAFFVWGLLELYEATFEVKYLKHAVALTNYMVDHFWDESGVFLTSDEGEHILVRQQQTYDGALPSGTAVATLNVLRLARITGDTQYEEKAAHVLRILSHDVEQMPSSHTFLLLALDFAQGPSFEVVVVGDYDSEDTQTLITQLQKVYIPNKVVIFRPDAKMSEITALSPFTKELTTKNGKATAYVCQNYTCNLPTTDVSTMLAQLSQ